MKIGFTYKRKSPQKIKTRDKKKFKKTFLGRIFWGKVSLGGNFPGGCNFPGTDFLRGDFLGAFFIEPVIHCLWALLYE